MTESEVGWLVGSPGRTEIAGGERLRRALLRLEAVELDALSVCRYLENVSNAPTVVEKTARLRASHVDRLQVVERLKAYYDCQSPGTGGVLVHGPRAVRRVTRDGEQRFLEDMYAEISKEYERIRRLPVPRRARVLLRLLGRRH